MKPWAKQDKRADKVIITYCNSDEGNCANNSQRSGYNRCNAYPLAKGKYIAHVDADDYLAPDFVEYMLSLIESNNADFAYSIDNIKSKKTEKRQKKDRNRKS